MIMGRCKGDLGGVTVASMLRSGNDDSNCDNVS